MEQGINPERGKSQEESSKHHNKHEAVFQWRFRMKLENRP